MKASFYRIGLAVIGVMMLAGTGIGGAVPSTTCTHSDSSSAGANSASASDGATCVLEPILTRSDKAAVFVTDGQPEGLDASNIKSFTIAATAGKVTATVTTSRAIPTNITQLLNPTTGVRAPYGGVHVLALFQSPTLELEQTVGPTLTGTPALLGPFKLSDNAHWFLYYGTTVSEGGVPTCGMGYYDQFGQIFFVASQSHDKPQNYTCSNNQTTKTVTMSFPYTTTYTLQPDNLPRSIKIARSGDAITNAKAFSWTDHEVGGPQPVGLVIGLTWYTDVVPSTGYDFGLIAGDPNSGGIPGPKCQYFAGRRVPNPLYDGSACYLGMPTAPEPVGYSGLGMKGTNLDFSAA